MLGSTVGGYRVEGLIASGGMGAVYRATQISVERPVALKVINAKHQRDPEFAERFRREGHAQANLHHPNIVTVIEPGVDGDIVFLAMLLVDGPSLEEALIDGPLSPDRAIDLLRQVASALDFAHE